MAVQKLWERLEGAQEAKPADKVLHPDFAERLNKAADLNPNVPPLRSGRLTWVKAQLAKRGSNHEVSLESVRKWFHGEAKPHRSRTELLAEILRIDEAWLILGTEATASPQQRRLRNAMVDGAVNFVAGLCQMDGAAIAFPEEDDRYAIAQHIDLTAIIRGASYQIHVIVGEARDGRTVFDVPTELRNTVPVGVVREGDEGFNFCLYEITDLAIEMGEPGRTGKVEVAVGDEGIREIQSFKDRF